MMTGPGEELVVYSLTECFLFCFIENGISIVIAQSQTECPVEQCWCELICDNLLDLYEHRLAFRLRLAFDQFID